MDGSDFVLWFIAFLVYVLSVTLAYQGGRKYEEKFWLKAIPEQMSKLCEECRGLR